MAAASANPAIQVTAKKYSKNVSPEIVNVIETTWKSALDGYGTSNDKKEIKTKSIGVLDVKMEDQTHLYVIACSSHGLNDIIVAEVAKIARIWKDRKDDISKKIKGVWVNDICIIADVGPSTQCYCSIPSTRAVTEFNKDEQKAYWDEIKQRLENRKRELESKFSKTNDVQHRQLAKLLWKSVFGAKFKVDKLPKKDFELLVDWHKGLIEKPVENTITSFIELAKQPYEDVIPYLCDKFEHLKGKENLLKAATDPENKNELPKRLEILGLRFLDREGILFSACLHVCIKPNLSRIADYFAQCAEDNATIALMEYLESNPSKKVASLDWFSTKWSKGDAVDKPLCGVCAIRFKDRLEWLLSSQGNEEMEHPDDIDCSPDTNVDCSPVIKYNKIFIENIWHDSTSGDTYPIYNPSTGDKICDVAMGNEEDVGKAVDVAQKALQSMEASQRGNLLNTLADFIERDSENLARLETKVNSKPLPNTYLPDVVDCYRYFAWLATKIQGGTLPDDGPFRCFTKESGDVVGLIISGDFPLLMQAWTLGPTLCAGNTVVIKPAKENPCTSLHIASLIAEAGFPPGVVNVVTGDENTTGAAVATHPKINKVLFVGSTDVGHQVLSQARGNSLKGKKITMMLHKDGVNILNRCNLTVLIELRCSVKLPLGGKGSTVIFVFADADLEDAVKKICCAPYFRFSEDQSLPYTIVEESKYKEFVKKSIEEARKYNKGVWCIKDSAGCTMKDKNNIPLMKILKFNFNDIFISLPDNSPMYDIAAAIFTTNVENAMKIVKSLNASTVWVNCYDAFCHQAPLQGKVQALVASRRNPLVQEKNFNQESRTSYIRYLIKAIWDSISKGSKDAFKDKSIGVLDATLDDQSHLYVIACSSTGLNNMVAGEGPTFKQICKQLKLGVNCLIANIGPSTQCYCAVPPTTPLSEFDEDEQEAYCDEIEKRMTNHKTLLQRLLDYREHTKLSDDQLKKLKAFLKNSIFTAKFKGQLSEEDIDEVVNWHKSLIEGDNWIEVIICLIKDLSPGEYVGNFLSLPRKLSQQKVENLEANIVKLLKADQRKFNYEQYKQLELDTTDEKLNNDLKLKPPNDFIIRRFCEYSVNYARLGDYLAQCAEDNATVTLIKHLNTKGKKLGKKVASVDWFGTELSKSGTIVHKPLCGVCAIRFKDRLEWLLLMSSRDIKYNKIFIENTWHDSTSGDTYPIYNRCTKDKICDVAKGNKEDVDKAVATALKALQPWCTMEASQRGELLNKLADLIKRDSEFLTHLNSGSNDNLPRVISCYRDYARAASENAHEPVAIVGHIIYGYFPLLMQAWVLGSTLCRGNTVILKPSELTPLSSLYVASLTVEAGFPPGVVSIVPGVGPTVGDAMATRNNDVGDIIFKGHPKRLLIIFDDADLNDVINSYLFAIFMGPEGQSIRTHTYVQKSVYEEFVSRSVKLANKIKVGNPLDWGPLVNKEQLNRTRCLIESAVKEGAKLQCSGKRHGDQRYFIEPTILSDVTEDMHIAKEEIFGPVMIIIKFETIEEVVRRTNNPIYNSNCAVFTTNKTQFSEAVNRMRRGEL